MRAKLIHRVPVVLKTIKTGSGGTTVDSVFKEAEDIVYNDPITVQAQVARHNEALVVAIAAGKELQGDGYLLVKSADADQITMFAVITNIGSETVDYQVIEKTPAVHYDDAQMVLVMYERKTKGKDRGSGGTGSAL